MGLRVSLTSEFVCVRTNSVLATIQDTPNSHVFPNFNSNKKSDRSATSVCHFIVIAISLFFHIDLNF